MRISDWSSDVCSSDLLGSVRLSELESVEGPLGLGIERDLYFEARYPLSVYAEAARRADSIVTATRLLDDAALRLGHSLDRSDEDTPCPPTTCNAATRPLTPPPPKLRRSASTHPSQYRTSVVRGKRGADV